MLMILRVKRSVLPEFGRFLSSTPANFLPLREVTASVFVLKENTTRCANMSSLLASHCFYCYLVSYCLQPADKVQLQRLLRQHRHPYRPLMPMERPSHFLKVRLNV